MKTTQCTDEAMNMTHPVYDSLKDFFNDRYITLVLLHCVQNVCERIRPSDCIVVELVALSKSTWSRRLYLTVLAKLMIITYIY